MPFAPTTSPKQSRSGEKDKGTVKEKGVVSGKEQDGKGKRKAKEDNDSDDQDQDQDEY